MQDQRKSARRGFDRRAWIIVAPGAAPMPCTFHDLSKSGARLRVKPKEEIPIDFILHLSSNGSVARKCTIVWRSEAGDEIGVQFIARLASENWRPPAQAAG